MSSMSPDIYGDGKFEECLTTHVQVKECPIAHHAIQ